MDLKALKRSVNTPGYKLDKRGANPSAPDVQKVHETEDNFIGQIAGSTSISGNTGAVDRSTRDYKEAIEALPSEVQKAIIPDGVEKAIQTVQRGVTREVEYQAPGRP